MAKNLTGEELRGLLRSKDSLGDKRFPVLRSIASLVNNPKAESWAREVVLRALERREEFGQDAHVLDALARETGYFPYCVPENLGLGDYFAYEAHRPFNLEDIVFHSEQAAVYRKLLSGESVILSAPTSFGKSRITDAMIASGRYKNIAVIVPTIALIDETRRRLGQFGQTFKIITHLSQKPGVCNILVFTAERAIAYEHFPNIDFLVIDEFYKIDAFAEDNARTVALNQAFYKLRKKGTQFYLLGPSIQTIPDKVEGSFHCSFFKTNYSTVVTEQHKIQTTGEDLDSLVDLAKTLIEPTLIFCKSPDRVNAVAHKFLAAGIGVDSPGLLSAAEWTAANFHEDWVYGKALVKGIGLHHGRLPRALAHFGVSAFNDGRLRFLLCTTTLIEGVNTKAKNVIVFDNTVARKKLDFFTFNNIRGRSGRMFQHFVGRVFVFHDPPQEELPFVDFPLLTQAENVPESLLIQMDPPDLSAKSKGRIKQLVEQKFLPLEVLKLNSTIDPEAQIELAKLIAAKPDAMSQMLAWNKFPTWAQLEFACNLVWDILVAEKQVASVFSGSQLAMKINQLRQNPNPFDRILMELKPGKYAAKNADEAVERVLLFDRRWANFEFPKYLMALSRIQQTVLGRSGRLAGDYTVFASQCEALFKDHVSIALEEYGIPLQLADKLRGALGKPDDLDVALARVRQLDPKKLRLTPFELELLTDSQAGLG